MGQVVAVVHVDGPVPSGVTQHASPAVQTRFFPASLVLLKGQ
jgi:hypothetical protein